ncbi:MAG TPA: T9SS type A sorting domain-containing protein, partial [Candidatus Krumholzibacteriaceae bacterium]
SGDNIWVVGNHYLIRHLENGTWVTQYQASNDIMVQRLDTLGTKMWTESGAPASVDIDEQRAPSVAYGPPGDALLAWSDNRNGNWDIYARKVSISRGPIVATELMSFTAQRLDDGVKVSWQLSQYTEGATFTLSRADGGQDAGWRVIAPAIARDRLSFSFVDSAVVAGSSYRYCVQVSDERGSRALFETDTIILPPLPLTLRQNFPNPFNPSTAIRYYVPGKCRVRLEVYDVSGRLVARLVDRDQHTGHYGIEWNGRDNLGKQAASGIYFCRLQAGKNVRSRKMVLVR